MIGCCEDSAERDSLRDALEAMAHQFGYRGVRESGPVLTTGGLSALEDAFAALGWENPHAVPINECACEVEGCLYWREGGMPWRGLYLSLCAVHMEAARQGQRRPRIRRHALKRERMRGGDGVLRT